MNMGTVHYEITRMKLSKKLIKPASPLQLQ